MWFVPSRSRPHNLARLARIGVRSPVLVRLDDDDPMLAGYEAPHGWTLEVGPRFPLSALYNDFFAARPDLGWYGFLADDVTPETPGWEEALITAAGKDGLAFGDDGINGERHAAHFVLGGDLVRAVGVLSLPGLERLFIDTFWNVVAQRLAVFRYLPHVRMTHRHFSNRKALMDATYRKPGKENDRAIYEAWSREFHKEKV